MTFDHILVLFAALVVELIFYAALVIVHGGGGEFLQAAIVGTAVAIAAIATPKAPPK